MKNNKIYFFNTLTNSKEEFKPLDEKAVSIYVCGPTVYQRLHIGNFRSIVCYDLLLRILKYVYGNVKYIRNITDIDDKIIAEAKKRNISESALTQETIAEFRKECKFLNCLEPTIEPKATESISSMVEMIQQLLSKGYAYWSEGNKEVLFDVKKYQPYGQLSGRNLEDMIEGSRIQSANKNNGFDFVLWKNVDQESTGWQTELGYGRPGWHIECSAMSKMYLGEKFDIHGGGADLMFPHHENEIAQTKSCYGESSSANFWVHNGALNVDGKKMSKSLGNVIYNDLDGNPLLQRYILMSSHYRKPMEYNDNLIKAKTKEWNRINLLSQEVGKIEKGSQVPNIEFLLDDINTGKYCAEMNKMIKAINKSQPGNQRSKMITELKTMADFIGII